VPSRTSNPSRSQKTLSLFGFCLAFRSAAANALEPFFGVLELIIMVSSCTRSHGCALEPLGARAFLVCALALGNALDLFEVRLSVLPCRMLKT
jgi:hypothetical protein